MHENRPKKVKRVRFPPKPPKGAKNAHRSAIDHPNPQNGSGFLSIYNPGNDFFWREEGPCRARARTSPARPSLGVPPTRFGGFPATALGQTRLNLQVKVS